MGEGFGQIKWTGEARKGQRRGAAGSSVFGANGARTARPAIWARRRAQSPVGEKNVPSRPVSFALFASPSRKADLTLGSRLTWTSRRSPRVSERIRVGQVPSPCPVERGSFRSSSGQGEQMAGEAQGKGKLAVVRGRGLGGGGSGGWRGLWASVTSMAARS